MTIDQAVAKLDAEIAVLLERRLDDMAGLMIANGADPTKPPAPPDPDTDWQPVSFDEVLERQRAIDAEWKTEALAQIRKWLEAECCQCAPVPTSDPIAEAGRRPSSARDKQGADPSEQQQRT